MMKQTDIFAISYLNYCGVAYSQWVGKDAIAIRELGAVRT